MAVMPRVEQPKIEIERKIGNTTYIVNGFLPPKASPFPSGLFVRLTRKQKSKKLAKMRENLRFYLTFDII